MKGAAKAGALIVGAVVLAIGAGTVGSLLSSYPHPVGHEITYSDIVVIMLTAISVLITLLGFILAVLAFIGWNSISDKVGGDVKAYLNQGFKEGEQLREMFRTEFLSARASVMYEGIPRVDPDFDQDADAEAKEEQP